MINRSSLGRCVWMTLAAIVIGLTGCSSSTQSGSPFVGEWGKRLDNLGFMAVMPPSEDVRVGDIYVSDVDPSVTMSAAERHMAARRIASTGRWSALPVLDELQAEYSQRRAWPITPSAFAKVSQDPTLQPVWQEPLASDGMSLFRPDDSPTRLRVVGMAGFTAVSFSTEDMDLVIPTEIATLVSGELRPDTVSVTMRVGSAESYALSQSDAIGLLTEQVTADDGGMQYRVSAPYRDNLEFMADAVTGRVWLHLITEVVYIRTADIAVRSMSASLADDMVTHEELTTAANLAAAATQNQPQTSAVDPATGDAASAPPQPAGALLAGRSEDVFRGPLGLRPTGEH